VTTAPPRTARESLHSAASVEHYTPPEYVEAARETLGGITLDPASSKRAQSVVKADTYFTAKENGFLRPWYGRVFLNPPGGRCDKDGHLVIIKSGATEGCRVTGACGLPPGHGHVGVTSSAKVWWQKLMREVASLNVTSAIFVGFSLEILQTTQELALGADGEPLLSCLAYPIAIPRSRVDYYVERPDGTLGPEGQPTHASFFVCVSEDPATIDRFWKAFSKFGSAR
jgi:hypothetical protein